MASQVLKVIYFPQKMQGFCSKSHLFYFPGKKEISNQLIVLGTIGPKV
jgi:hypothetical protein